MIDAATLTEMIQQEAELGVRSATVTRLEAEQALLQAKYDTLSASAEAERRSRGEEILALKAQVAAADTRTQRAQTRGVLIGVGVGVLGTAALTAGVLNFYAATLPFMD